MAFAARTAPKGKGTSTLDIHVLAKKDMKKLATRLENVGNDRIVGFSPASASPTLYTAGQT